jgi:hypothetical protein
MCAHEKWLNVAGKQCSRRAFLAFEGKNIFPSSIGGHNEQKKRRKNGNILCMIVKPLETSSYIHTFIRGSGMILKAILCAHRAQLTIKYRRKKTLTLTITRENERIV